MTKKGLICAVLISAVMFLACPPTPTLYAAFTFSPARPAAGQDVLFKDASSGKPTAWAWAFGDGASSSIRNPSHAFAEPGSYPVSLMVSNAQGHQKSVTRTLVVGQALVASFTWQPAYLEAEIEMTFTDTSQGSPTGWAWDFGDGQASTLQNPVHTFAVGAWKVVLTISRDGVTATQEMNLTVAPPLNAWFEWTPAKPISGQEVQFFDRSTGTGIVKWEWDFGDGGASLEQNPKHTYLNDTGADKTFVITLTVTDDHGQFASLKIFSDGRQEVTKSLPPIIVK